MMLPEFRNDAMLCYSIHPLARSPRCQDCKSGPVNKWAVGNHTWVSKRHVTFNLPDVPFSSSRPSSLWLSCSISSNF